MNGILLACPLSDPRLTYAERVLTGAGLKICYPERDLQVESCNAIVLPMPSKRFVEGNPHRLDALLNGSSPNAVIFASDGAYLEGLDVLKGHKIWDYSLDEDLLTINTVATCEGAISLLISQTTKTLRCSRVLITGWGRLAKCLFYMLKRLNADLTICARSPTARGEILSLGCECVDINNIYNPIKASDIIVNTVPARLIDGSKITFDLKEKLFLELASPPYGYDPCELSALGARCVSAPALPSRFAPESSGLAIGRAICRIISEGNII